MQMIKESWKRVWNTKEIRILVLASLCFQFGLVFLSPWRKRTAKKPLILLLWSFYLLADYVSTLALGNLLKKQNDDASGHHNSVGLKAFWAPFLLLHLGGPDTITSYSIEDTELWWRHFLGLAFQVVVAFMVLLELLAMTRLCMAASLVFIAGTVKYVERTWALPSASMNQLRDSMVKDPDPGPSYAEFMQEYVWRRKSGQSAYVKRKNEPPPPPPLPSNAEDSGNIYDIRQIDEAYKFFKRFKPLVVDLMLTFQERKDSQTYFWNCSAYQAFKVVEMELSFLYDVLHTKAIHLRCLCGCVWRCTSLGVISVAFTLFLNCEKQGYPSADIIISYVLFGGALFLELTSLVLIIISDWMIVTLKEHKWLNKIAIAIAKVMSSVFPKGKPRWSNSMSQYNLLSFSLGDKSTKIRRIIIGIFKVKQLWDNSIFIHSVGVPCKLKELLFEELKTTWKSARHTADFKELKDCKGEKALQQEGCNHLRWSIDKEFDESILLWHVATDLCFHTNGCINENPDTGHGRNGNSCHSDHEISLKMSDYMLYLLIMQPSMMPAGIGKIRFKDTCAEAKVFFRAEEKGLTESEAREALLDVETEVDPVEVKGDRSKSVLFDACRLAKELNPLVQDERWRLISRVWVEMLGYAAINCKTYYHAKQLSQGGELLTHVWLLMAHMAFNN